MVKGGSPNDQPDYGLLLQTKVCEPDGGCFLVLLYVRTRQGDNQVRRVLDRHNLH